MFHYSIIFQLLIITNHLYKETQIILLTNQK